ncbi:MAG: SGNH/GDSL hydrolase family protein [Acidobacteria bacterium]|nr:MAG: SGNH/GDSL hydrolase family protein [Acidobacteriota bacterium]REK09753.1 MAG: SGNH/GDSL hydrolase family protein [Acidobacteriota bacterium]
MRLSSLLVACAIGLLVVELGLRWLGLPGGGDRLSAQRLEQRLAESAAADLEQAQQQAGGAFSLYGLVEPSPSRDVVYELKPHLHGGFRGEPLRTNRWGHRQDDEPEIDKPSGVWRLVGLGDSHMFGWGVAQGESYLDRVRLTLAEEVAARADLAAVEVINCAAPGYNTHMEVALFEAECRAFSPDLVLLHWIGNDSDFPHFLRPVVEATQGEVEATAAGAAEIATARRGPLSRLRTYRVIAELLAGREHQPESVGDAADEMDPEQIPDLLPHSQRTASKEVRQAARRQYRDSVGISGVLRALDRLRELVEPTGTPVVVLMLGTGNDDRQAVAEHAARLGFEVVDASGHFARSLERELGGAATRQQWQASYQIPEDGHPSAKAHERYAEVVLEVVRRRLAAATPAQAPGAATGAR